jgi:hypothetical protein
MSQGDQCIMFRFVVVPGQKSPATLAMKRSVLRVASLVHDCDQKDPRGGFREAKNFPMIEDIAISRKRLVQDSNPNQTCKEPRARIT